MSTSELRVLIGDVPAGTLVRSAGGQLRFVYDEDYGSRADATPLSVTMPLEVVEHSHATISAWLWGLLPDDELVRARWGRRFHVSVTSPFSLLATPLGEDCPGAVRLVQPDRLEEVLAGDAESRDDGTDEDDDLRWLTEVEVADLLRELVRDHTSWLGRDFTGRFSLAGAQAKTALLRHEGRWAEPGGRYATSHLLKPAISGFDEHDLNEHLCLTAMGSAGLPAARTRIVRFSDTSAVVITRYDRVGRGLRRDRIHQEDMCQALGKEPGQKYQADGGPSPEDVAGLIRRTHPSEAADVAVRKFFDALVWNWAIAGTDAHAKNYSILLAGKQVRLAPLYDVASSLPYGTDERRLKLAMKFGSGYKLNPGGSPWRHLARAMKMNEDEVRERAGILLGALPNAFHLVAEEHTVKELGSALPGRLADLVEDRARRCVAVLQRV